MKIIEDVSYITRIWTIEGINTAYTVIYKEGRSNFEWTIEGETKLGTFQVDPESETGLELIRMCVETMGIEN
jgi:hypothetical protein